MRALPSGAPRPCPSALATASRRACPLTSAVTLAALAVIAAIATSILGGCAGAPPTTSLRVKGAPQAPKDASVTIDDQYVGALAFVAARGVALPEGKHRVTVEKAGYFPWDRVVEARHQPIYLEVELTRIPD